MVIIKKISYKGLSQLNNDEIEIDFQNPIFILGKNGSGKTTLMNNLNNILNFHQFPEIDNFYYNIFFELSEEEFNYLKYILFKSKNQNTFVKIISEYLHENKMDRIDSKIIEIFCQI